MGDFHLCFRRVVRDFVVFAEASAAIEPGEGSFNDPAFRKNCPSFWQFENDVNQAIEGEANIIYKCAAIPAIRTDALQGRVLSERLFKDKAATD